MAVAQVAEPGRWPVEQRLGRFEFHADFDCATSQELLDEVTALEADVSRLLGPGMVQGKQPVHIVLFGERREYGRYMRTYFPSLPQRRALYLQARGPGMLFAYWHDDLSADLRHELTHALLNDGAGPLPLWLDEGLAEYFEAAAPERFRGNGYLGPIVERAQRGIVPRIAELERRSDPDQFGDAEYRDSWSWVHFLLHRDERTRALLVRYLTGNLHGESLPPISRLIGQVCDDAEADYLAHFRALDDRTLGQAAARN